uniref:Chitinase domain-containing protein 1 n=1 Tax=Toxocara canis TaxID=6265 RepID=A0A183VBP2_TOXCA
LFFCRLLIELVASWSDYFHAKDLEFILPISPPLNEISYNDYKFRYEYTSIISAENFAEVAKHVDYINIMLYDYHIDRAAGVAPIGWIQRNMEFLLRESPVSASKVLMGLNFYGFEFTPTKMNAITFSNTTICYYPSLASLSVRLRYAERMNMGVSIWELGQGLPYFTRLL